MWLYALSYRRFKVTLRSDIISPAQIIFDRDHLLFQGKCCLWFLCSLEIQNTGTNFSKYLTVTEQLKSKLPTAMNASRIGLTLFDAVLLSSLYFCKRDVNTCAPIVITGSGVSQQLKRCILCRRSCASFTCLFLHLSHTTVTFGILLFGIHVDRWIRFVSLQLLHFSSTFLAGSSVDITFSVVIWLNAWSCPRCYTQFVQSLFTMSPIHYLRWQRKVAG